MTVKGLPRKLMPYKSPQAIRIAASRKRRRLVSLAVVIVIVAAVSLVYQASRWNPPVDSALCPNDSSKIPLDAILFLDSTDPWSVVRKSAIAINVSSIIDTLPLFSRLSIYVVRNDSLSAKADTVLCNPGTMAHRSTPLLKFVVNDDTVKARSQAFAAVIDAAISNVGAAEPQQRSPILETIRQASMDRKKAGAKDLVLYVVSDMYQNSDAFSFYQGEDAAPETAKRIADPSVLGTSVLKGARVSLLLLTPEGGEFIPRRELVYFFEHYFRAQGAPISSVIRVEN